MSTLTVALIGFIGFLSLSAECESFTSFLLSKLVGFALLLLSYIVYKATNTEQQSNILSTIKQDENELI